MELPLLLLVRPPIAVLGRSDSREGRWEDWEVVDEREIGREGKGERVSA